MKSSSPLSSILAGLFCLVSLLVLYNVASTYMSSPGAPSGTQLASVSNTSNGKTLRLGQRISVSKTQNFFVKDIQGKASGQMATGSQGFVVSPSKTNKTVTYYKVALDNGTSGWTDSSGLTAVTASMPQDIAPPAQSPSPSDLTVIIKDPSGVVQTNAQVTLGVVWPASCNGSDTCPLPTTIGIATTTSGQVVFANLATGLYYLNFSSPSYSYQLIGTFWFYAGEAQTVTFNTQGHALLAPTFYLVKTAALGAPVALKLTPDSISRATVSLRVNWGDGTPSVLISQPTSSTTWFPPPVASHTYASLGTYYPTLTEITSLGAMRAPRGLGFTPPMPLAIVSQGSVPLSVSAGGPYSGPAQTTISFSPTSSNPPLLKLINYGDGSPISPTFGHAYATQGSYTATTIVTDSALSQVAANAPVSVGAPCSYTITPTTSNMAAAGGNGSVSITSSNSVCPWTASSNVPWIIVSQTSGLGNGQVSYIVNSNSGTTARTGTLTIAGQTYTLTQNGLPVVGNNTATRTLPATYTAGTQVSVSIAVSPAPATIIYSVEETPPAGWAVNTASISGGGSWDSANGKVKWGPCFVGDACFSGAGLTLSYTATPPAGTTGTKTFAGVTAFDNIPLVTITGNTTTTSP